MNTAQARTADALTAGLVEAALLGLAAVVICVIVFDNLRRQYPVVFEYRHHLHETGLRRDACNRRVYSLPSPPCRRFAWFTPTISHELRALARTHGPDTALHLRLLRLHVLLFGISMFTVALPLSILYATSPRADSPGLARIGATNVTASTRYWAAATLQLVLTVTGALLLLTEVRVYRELIARSRYSRSPCNYALLVACAPRGAALTFDDAVAVIPIRPTRNVGAARAVYRRALRVRERAEAIAPDEAATEDLRNTEHRLENELRAAITAASASDAPVRSCVVIYPTRAATAAALTDDARVKAWRIARAPEPAAVDWKSLMGMPELARSRAFAACVPLFLATLLGVGVAAAVEGFVRLETVTRIKIAGVTPLAFAQPVARIHFVGAGIIQAILPAALLAVSLAPMSGFAQKIAIVFRTPTKQRRDSIARSALLLLTVWTVVVARFGVAVLYEVAGRVPGVPYNRLIAEVAASHGWFACVFIVLKGCFTAGGALCQVRRVRGRNTRLRQAVSVRDHRDADDWRAHYTYVDAYAEAQLVAIVGLMYAPVTPVVLIVAFLWHLLHFPPTKYRLCYACRELYDGAGELFPAALWCLVLALFVAHAGLTGFLGLRLAVGPTVVAGAPMLLFPLAAWWLHRALHRVVEENDVESTGAEEEEKEFVRLCERVYVQPEFRPVEDEMFVDEDTERRESSRTVAPPRKDGVVKPSTPVVVEKKVEVSAASTAEDDGERKGTGFASGLANWAFGWGAGNAAAAAVKESDTGPRNSSVDWADASSK